MISMDKTYKTADGQPMRVLCIDANGVYPVISLCVSGVALMHRADGTQYFDERFNLIEVGPYDDFKIDEKVMVRDTNHEDWRQRLFRGINAKDGRAHACQLSSWTKDKRDPSVWHQCRRPTAEELAA